jgi:hypothetical protein
MSIFEQLEQQAGGFDLEAIGQRFGLSADQVRRAASQLLPQLANPAVDNDQATANVAAQTGIPHQSLTALIPELIAQARSGSGGQGGGALQEIMAGISGGGGGGGLAGSLLGKLGQL